MLFLSRNSSPSHPHTKNVLMTKAIRKHLRMCGMKTRLGMPCWMNDKNLLFIQGVVFIPLQKSGKGRGNRTHQLTMLTLYGVISIVTFVAAVEQWQTEFQPRSPYSWCPWSCYVSRSLSNCKSNIVRAIELWFGHSMLCEERGHSWSLHIWIG